MLLGALVFGFDVVRTAAVAGLGMSENGLWRIFHLLERKEIYGVIKFIDIIPITYAQG
jgi:hypothetical protein